MSDRTSRITFAEVRPWCSLASLGVLDSDLVTPCAEHPKVRPERHGQSENRRPALGRKA